jgi:hypothetical protein
MMRKKSRKLNKYIYMLLGVIILAAIAVPGVSAYEGHRINITAHVKGEVECGVTRTPGWWTNRPDAINWVLTNRIPGHTFNMGWPYGDVNSVEKIMGIFWADQTKEMDCNGELITPPTRDTLCKKRAQASFQVLAAILTSYCPGGMPLPIPIGEIQDIMLNGTADEVLELHNFYAAFNLSADNDSVPLGIPDSELGSVNSTTAKIIAWEQFANCSGPPVCP